MRFLLPFAAAIPAFGNATTLEEIEAKLPLIDDHIARLAQAEPWITVLTLAVLLAGMASAIVAAFDGVWVKRTGVILGAIVASISGYRASTFGLDAQTCELVRKKAQNSLSLVRRNVDDYRRHKRPEYRDLAVKYKSELDQLEPLMEKVGRPLFSLPIVRAQSVGADTTIQAQGWGSGRCDSETAAFDLARHDALDRLARSVNHGENPSPDLIVYLREKATVVAEKCSAAQGWHTCELRLEIPRIYLNPDIVATFRRPDVAQSGLTFTGRERHLFMVDNDAFSVDGKTSSGEKFDFRMRKLKGPDGQWTVRVEQIKRRATDKNAGDWLLQVSIDGVAAALPFGSYGQPGVESRCDVSGMRRQVTLPKGGPIREVVVRGSRP